MSRAVLLAALALACVACNDLSTAATTKKKEAPAAPPPPPVTVVAPEYRTRASRLETTGKVQFNEENVVRVQSPATGRVVQVLVQPGDFVEPGRRLFVIDSADLGAAKADYAKAASDVERAEKNIALVRELVDAKAIAQKELRDAENEQRKAVAERERAGARLRTLGVTQDQLPEIARRADSGTTVTVIASRSGVVVERNVSPGQIVEYGTGDSRVNLVVIADLSTMWVLADVYEPDVPAVRAGQSVTVWPACCPNERVDGKISYISDIVDKDSRTVKVRAVVPNRGRMFKAEMFVKVAIGTATTRVLTIPESAVHREGGQAFVLVEQGKDDYARRAVKLGGEMDGAVEVQDGLTPSDRVVASGSILLKKSAK